LKGHWDRKKTLKQNYANLGLALDPNELKKKIFQKPEVEEMVNDEIVEEENAEEPIMEEEDEDITEVAAADSRPVDELEKSVARRSANLKPRKTFLSEAEVATIRKLFKKHGKNFQAMARDIKINRHQLTASQLRDKFRSYEVDNGPLQ